MCQEGTFGRSNQCDSIYKFLLKPQVMTSPTGVQISNPLSGINPYIGILNVLLLFYQILFCTSVDISPLFSESA